MRRALTSGEFERRTLRPLRLLAWRLRGYLLLDGLAVAMVAAAAAAGGPLLLDWRWHLQVDMRAVLLAVVVALLGFIVWRRVLTPLGSAVGPPEMALLVERRFPELRSVLISAVRFQRGEVGAAEANSPQLMRKVLEQAAGRTAGLPLTQVLNHKRARLGSGVVLAVLAGFTLALVLAPATMGIWFERAVLLKETPWPQRTRLVVELEDGVLRGVRGDDLEVRAYVPPGYETPRLVEIILTCVSGRTGRERMIQVGQRGYRHTFNRAAENFEFCLKGGDERTKTYRAELADRPRVERATITVVPPAYTGLEACVLAQGQRSIEVLPGSEISLVVETNKPVERAMLMSDGDALAQAAFDGQAWRVTLRPAQSQTVHFRLIDDLGLENRRPVHFALRLLKDEAPRVRMRLPGAGDMVTALAVLPVELAVSDDYGLARAELVYQITGEGEAERTIETPGFNAGQKRYEVQVDVPVASLAAMAGDRITLYARAFDLDEVSGPNLGHSNAVTLRIVPRDELLAELARREQACRAEFERAIDAQEELRGQLLTIIGRVEQWSGKQAEQMAGAERRQRQVAAQVNGIRRRFEQMMAQMRVNRLDTELVRRRLGDGVIAPLGRLAKRDLPAAADDLRRLGRAAAGQAPELASRIDRQQVALLAAMRAALVRMLQWEGFQETVTMLRQILRLQTELNAETIEEIERQAADVFEDE